jgi:hypothetical protein
VWSHGTFKHLVRGSPFLLLVLSATASLSDTNTPRTWGDIAGRRLDLSASPAVPVMVFSYGDGVPPTNPVRLGNLALSLTAR